MVFAQTRLAVAEAVTFCGLLLTVTILVATWGPDGVVTVTEYWVVTCGLVVMDWVVSEVFQSHAVPMPPVSVRVIGGFRVQWVEGPLITAALLWKLVLASGVLSSSMDMEESVGR